MLLFTTKFGPKMENGPQPARAELTLRARPRSGPKPKTARGPLALRPRSACHAAMRPETETGPLALSASRAPGCNLGLGRKSLFPPGPKLGPVIMSHPCQSNGYAKFPAEQNCTRCPRANPSPHSFLSAPTHTPQQAPSDSVGRRA
jgi:hypothetical protein